MANNTNTKNELIKTIFLAMVFFSIMFVVLGNTMNNTDYSNLTKRINELFPLVDFTDLTDKYQ